MKIDLKGQPDIVTMIKDTYTGNQIIGIDVQEVSIEDDAITIKLDLTIENAWSVSGTATLSRLDDNSLVEAIEEIIG